MMYSNPKQILHKLLNTTDSDDVQSIASFIEVNLSHEEQSKLKNLLKEFIYKKGVNSSETLPIKQLLNFLE